jgi:hypothetical protein
LETGTQSTAASQSETVNSDMLLTGAELEAQVGDTIDCAFVVYTCFADMPQVLCSLEHSQSVREYHSSLNLTRILSQRFRYS